MQRHTTLRERLLHSAKTGSQKDSLTSSQIAASTTRIVSVTEGFIDREVRPFITASRELTGTAHIDFWRIALEVLRVTGLKPEEFADLSAVNAIAVLRAAAAMKGDQQQVIFQAIREAAKGSPKPGTRAANYLIGLFELGARDRDSSVTTEQVLKKIYSRSQGDNFKAVVAILRKHSFVETACGRSGGTWLTPIGQQIARHLAGKGV